VALHAHQPASLELVMALLQLLLLLVGLLPLVELLE
jgi:hypothetical protein